MWKRRHYRSQFWSPRARPPFQSVSQCVTQLPYGKKDTALLQKLRPERPLTHITWVFSLLFKCVFIANLAGWLPYVLMFSFPHVLISSCLPVPLSSCPHGHVALLSCPCVILPLCPHVLMTSWPYASIDIMSSCPHMAHILKSCCPQVLRFLCHLLIMFAQIYTANTFQ